MAQVDTLKFSNDSSIPPELRDLKDTVLTYFNASKSRTNRKKATYFRKTILQTDGLYFVQEFFIKSGQIRMTGHYSDDSLKKGEGEFHYFRRDGSKESTEFFVQGKWEGLSIWYYPNGNAASKELYGDGKLLSFELFNEDGSPDRIAKHPEFDAEFVGGAEALKNFIQDNVKYPRKAILKNQEERIIVNAVIEIDGSVSNVKAQQAKYPLLKAEAERLMVDMPKWKPAKEHNIIVRRQIRLPINFTFE